MTFLFEGLCVVPALKGMGLAVATLIGIWHERRR